MFLNAVYEEYWGGVQRINVDVPFRQVHDIGAAVVDLMHKV